MRNTLIFISTSMVFASPIVYIRSILHGVTRPHRTTRFVLMVLTLLSVSALLAGPKNAAFWLALASASQGLVIFVLSLKRGIGGWARLDIICLLIALMGVIIWQVTGRPVVGLMASIVADVVGNIPALIKTYLRPHTEEWRFYAIDTSAAILSLFATTTISPFALSYPIYIIVINATFVVLILRRQRQKAG